MLRRPISSVLSSLPLGSRLSTRLFTTTATSTNDQIPSVRTTGYTWVHDDIKHSVHGIYWGEGDLRNTKVQNENDKMDKEGTRMRSVLMALEQAQKDGLRKIRVQTDLAMNEFFIRKMVSKFKNNVDISSRTEPNLSKYMYCEKIVKIMDNMEVILEYRKTRDEDNLGNEVFMLLNEDMKNKKMGDLITLNSSPDRKICPTDAADSRSTVRTTAFGCKKDGIRGSMIGIYWGKDDPRNTIDQRRNDNTGTRGIMLRSILMALEQAQKNGLKQIHIQTDSDVDLTDIKTLANVSNNKEIEEINDIHQAQFGYCERIVKIMDEIEVILEYRPSWLEVGNEVMTLLINENQKSMGATLAGTFLLPH